MEIQKLINLRHIYVFSDGFGVVKKRKILSIASSFLVCIVGMMVILFH